MKRAALSSWSDSLNGVIRRSNEVWNGGSTTKNSSQRIYFHNLLFNVCRGSGTELCNRDNRVSLEQGTRSGYLALDSGTDSGTDWD